MLPLNSLTCQLLFFVFGYQSQSLSPKPWMLDGGGKVRPACPESRATKPPEPSRAELRGVEGPKRTKTQEDSGRTKTPFQGPGASRVFSVSTSDQSNIGFPSPNEWQLGAIEDRLKLAPRPPRRGARHARMP